MLLTSSSTKEPASTQSRKNENLHDIDKTSDNLWSKILDIA